MESSSSATGATLARLDRELFLAANRSSSPGGRRHQLLVALTRLGDTDAAVVHALALVALAPGGAHLPYFATIGGAMLLATVLAQILKRTIRRSRPSVAIEGFVPTTTPPDAYSFPSGHACGAFALATATFALDPTVGLAELSLAAAIAVSRVRLGAHYPIDVIAGAALGIACATGWARYVSTLVG